MANIELLPPQEEEKIAERRSVAPVAASSRTRAVVPPDAGVFRSMDRMQVKRDPKSTAIAVGIHALLIGIITYFVATKVVMAPPKKAPEIVVVDPSIPPKLPPKPTLAGGGGGQKGPAPVSKGSIPPPSPVQLNPPKLPPKIDPKLNIPVTADVPKMAATNLPNFGDPKSPLVGSSLGNGKGNAGIGSGDGAGAGPGSGGGIGGGIEHVGGGVSAPKLLFSPEPEFSEEARKAKVAGIVYVSMQVDPNGRPTHVHVTRGIGLGLDENAVAAVKQYRFTPAMKNGKPVTVEMNIEVNFQIY